MQAQMQIPNSSSNSSDDQSTELQPPDIAKWLQEGVALHRLGRLNEAKLFYERILQEQSNHLDALQLLAVKEPLSLISLGLKIPGQVT